jgi:hypothetical protein
MVMVGITVQPTMFERLRKDNALERLIISIPNVINRLKPTQSKNTEDKKLGIENIVKKAQRLHAKTMSNM